MAKNSNAKGLSNLLGKLRVAMENLPPSLYDKIGSYVSSRVVMKARTGKRMFNGEEEKLKALSPGYVAQRKALLKGEKQATRGLKGKDKKQATKNFRDSKAKVDSDFFSPGRSNLTRTGQYLKSITHHAVPAKNRIIVQPTGFRDDDLSNQELAKHLAKGGRGIFAIDKQTKTVIAKLVKEEIRKQIRKKVLRK